MKAPKAQSPKPRKTSTPKIKFQTPFLDKAMSKQKRK